MFSQPSEQRHPFSSLLLLLMIALGGLFLFGFLAIFIGYFWYGPAAVSVLKGGTSSIGMQKLFLSLSSIGMFIFPPLLFARLESRNPFSYLKINAPKPWHLLIVAIVLMMCAVPFIEWTVLINQQMKLPAFLQQFETWMAYKEIEAEILTKQLLIMNTVPDLLLNLVIIALIPAIGEEFLFRGCIQKIVTTWTNNTHLGIWIAAIVFSAIHIQFYGFLPRMILGALFGYLLVYSKSIWVPVAAHFFNNAYAVFNAFLLQKQGQSLDSLNKPELQKWYLVILSIIFTAILFRIFRKISVNYQKETHYERRLG